MALVALLLFGYWAYYTAYPYLRDRGHLTWGLPGNVPQEAVRLRPRSYLDVGVVDRQNPIYRRADDRRRLSVGEVFWGSAKSPSTGKIEFTLRGTRDDSECTFAVWGEDARKTLVAGGCSQVIRGQYETPGADLVGVVALFNFRDADGAATFVTALDQPDSGFVHPLRTGSPMTRVTDGGEAYGRLHGHYALITWVIPLRASGTVDPQQVTDVIYTLDNVMEVAYRRRAAAR